MRNYELEVPVSKNNNAIEKEDDKCITCGYCKKVCSDDVTIARMFEMHEGIEPLCINCGQCANICPTEAIHEKFDYLKVKRLLKYKKKKKIAFSIAPAVRVALGEDLGGEVGENLERKIPTALRKLGADFVFDVTFGADLTIMEEASELVDRIKSGKRLPQFTSCCPAWVKYCEIFYPEYLENLSTAKSPISMQSTIIKTYFASKMNLKSSDIINVTVAPCTAKKSEAERPELSQTAKDTDYVITTRELAMLLREEKINPYRLKDGLYDSPLGTGSGAGVIFGASGGVCEAALRTAYYFLTGTNLPIGILEFTDIRGMDGIKESAITINGKEIKVAVCNGMKNAKALIDKLKRKEVYYDFIEVMNCIGGCLAGGGQPKMTLLDMDDTKKKRMDALYSEDERMTLRLCHENIEIKEIYKNYFERPNSELAEQLLHTTYEDKSYLLGGAKND